MGLVRRNGYALLRGEILSEYAICLRPLANDAAGQIDERDGNVRFISAISFAESILTMNYRVLFDPLFYSTVIPNPGTAEI